MEQKFSNFGKVMEAANHLKNSAMETDTILKHGRISKSQTSRVKMLCFAFLASVFIFSGCKKDKDEPKPGEPTQRYETVPYSKSGVKSSVADNLEFTDYDDEYNYYFFVLGHINSVPLAYRQAVYYNGKSDLTIGYSSSNITQTSISSSIAEASEHSISKSNTTTWDNELGGKVEIGPQWLKFEASYKHNWGGSESTEKTNSRSFSNTFETSKSKAEEIKDEIVENLGNSDRPAGMYRWSLFSTTDVYFVVVTDRAKTKVIERFISFCARPSQYWELDYEPERGGSFKKTASGDLLKIPEIKDISQLPDIVCYHEWGEWIVIIPATCETEGKKNRICTLDERHIETRTIEATGHNWGNWSVTTHPTCETEGKETRICANDTKHFETRDIEATGHNWGNWVTTKQPTETDKGVDTRICTNCQYPDTRDIPALGQEIPTFNLADGKWDNKIDDATTWNGTMLYVNSNANIIIKGHVTGGRRIDVVQGARNVRITLRDVSITGLGSGMCPLAIYGGADVTLTLEGENTLAAGGDWAGIFVPSGATLTVGGSGSLTVTGGNNGAGIGGSVNNRNAGTIIINSEFSGTIKANGGNGGAGIGGGRGSDVNNIGGAGGNAGTVTISGGTVTAIGGIGGAGIGGGRGGNGTSTTIYMGFGGAGGNAGTVTISGGTVKADGGTDAAGIGGGRGGNGTYQGGGNGGNGGTVTINAGTTVIATGDNVPGIGGGRGGTNIYNTRASSGSHGILNESSNANVTIAPPRP